MFKIKDVLTGWKNYIDKSEVIELVAEERASICSACPFAAKEKILTFVKDDFKEVEGLICSLCKCPLSAKIRSNSKCELGKW